LFGMLGAMANPVKDQPRSVSTEKRRRLHSCLPIQQSRGGEANTFLRMFAMGFAVVHPINCTLCLCDRVVAYRRVLLRGVHDGKSDMAGIDENIYRKHVIAFRHQITHWLAQHIFLVRICTDTVDGNPTDFPHHVPNKSATIEVLRIIAATAGDKVIFKGGTSLSKGWNLIQRFSEDIDIFLDPLAFEPPLTKRGIDRELKSLRDAVAALATGDDAVRDRRHPAVAGWRFTIPEAVLN